VNAHDRQDILLLAHIALVGLSLKLYTELVKDRLSSQRVERVARESRS
jgi:hypothetical protein